MRGGWCDTIDVRDFIIKNVAPYDGDEKFLAAASRRTKAVWSKLQPYFQEERKKGVLAVDARTPSTMLAHKAGYIDRDNEVIVGLQTDQPFKRAIFPYGGLRMVEAGLKAAGFEADPQCLETIVRGPLMKRYSKDPNYEYSPTLRDELIAQELRLQGRDIEGGLAMLRSAAEKSPLLARALARAEI